MNARRSTVDIIYNSRTASQMAGYLRSFKYTDVASGSSDSIHMDLNDHDRHWIGGWFPKKGDRIQPTIGMHDWDEAGIGQFIRCGTFEIDDFSFEGGPLGCSIDALAIPSTSGFKATDRTYTYKNTTLKEIGQTVAKRNKLTLYYEPKTAITIENVAQDKQPDCTFYNDLVVKYGLAMKIFNDRLVVFDEAEYEAKKPVAVLTEADFEDNWTWNTSLTGTYTGVKYQYKHTTKDKTFSVTVGEGDRWLTCDDPSDNQTEATLIALAKLNNANKSTTTMKITMRANIRIMATDTVEIKGLGQLDGKYFVEQVTTSVGESTKMELSLRRVEKRFVKQAEPAKPVKVASSNPEKKTEDSKGTFKKGDRVRVVKGAKTYNGIQLASFVYTTVYTVIQVGGKGLPADRIVIGINGVVTAAVKASNLYRA